MKIDLEKFGRQIGLVNNFVATRFDPLARAIGRVHAKSQGTRFAKLIEFYMAAPVFALTVRGRKSGEPRTVMLILTRRGDDLVVAGSNGGHNSEPNWFRNLRAAGEARVKVDGKEWDVNFRIVEGGEREQCWELLRRVYPPMATYAKVADRPIPVAILERRA